LCRPAINKESAIQGHHNPINIFQCHYLNCDDVKPYRLFELGSLFRFGVHGIGDSYNIHTHNSDIRLEKEQKEQKDKGND
jgi:hypothetical protein